MNKKKLKILILSSISPYASANLGMDVISALETQGHEVYFLTKNKFEGMTSKMSFISEEIPKLVKPRPESTISRMKRKYPALKRIYKTLIFWKKNWEDLPVIVNKHESIPPIDPQLIIEKIKTINYDFVLTIFWQSMLTAQSLQVIYEKLKVPVLIQSVDMFPMTGGCYYFDNCRNFLNSCGSCPAIHSKDKNDSTHENFLVKKEAYKSIKGVFIGNSWMTSFAPKSPLLKELTIKKQILPINQNLFFPIDKKTLFKDFGIDPDKKFILFAGSSKLEMKRKGFIYLVKAIRNFVKKLPATCRKEILLLLAGKEMENIDKLFDIDVIQLGYIKADKLAKTYSVSNVFLSPSLDDAGPTMVTQSLMCGTPVVSFDVGVALDVVSSKTGHLAKTKDAEDFRQGIEYIYKLNEEERRQIEMNCRSLALEKFSLSVFAKNIEDIYHDIAKPAELT